MAIAIQIVQEHLLILTPKLANPFSPYSIQKRPKPQICPKFVPAIVFGGFQSGGLKFGKIRHNLSEKKTAFQVLTSFPNFSHPWLESPKTIAGTILDKFWGFGRL